MGEFSNYFNQQMENLMQYAGNDVGMIRYYRYYKKSRTRYRDILSLAYPFLLEGNKSVLDLGGYEMGAMCRPLAASVQCVSLSVPKEELQAHFDINVDVVDIMSPTFSLERKGYDLIFFCEVLEHLPPPTDLIMKRLRGLLNPGGAPGPQRSQSRLLAETPQVLFFREESVEAWRSTGSIWGVLSYPNLHLRRVYDTLQQVRFQGPEASIRKLPAILALSVLLAGVDIHGVRP